jgi:hypothetical protein
MNLLLILRQRFARIAEYESAVYLLAIQGLEGESEVGLRPQDRQIRRHLLARSGARGGDLVEEADA